MMRIGYGYDSHAFVEGKHIIIGGVKIPYQRGINAHSDGDVLLHAIGDALLGAAALGDLGHHFPDNDPVFRTISSDKLLTRIIVMLEEKNFRVNNVDATVITESPRLAAHLTNMRKNIAALLKISLSCVSVKAKTNEKLGWIGQGGGLAAHAVVTLL